MCKLLKYSFLIVALAGVLSRPLESLAQAANKAVQAKPADVQPGDNFLGDWEWSSGNEVFHITLERNPSWPVPFSPTHRTANVVLGNFRYTRNGAVLAASIRDPASADNGLFYSKIERQKMVMTFYDYVHEKSGLVILAFSVNSNDEITWKLQEVEEHINNTTPPNFSVPTAVTLTRQ